MYAWVRYPVRFLYKLFYDFHIEGIENIPQDKPVVLASNHRSYADPVILTMPMKLPVSYMAKEELFRNKLFGWFIRKLGAFPVVRGSGDMKVIDDSIKILESGRNLVIFPEGTRSKDGKVGKGKTGVAMIAAKSGADVVPCGIVFEGEKLHFRSKLTLKFGKPIKAEEIAVEGNSPRELKEVKKRIMGAITELVEGPALPGTGNQPQLEDKSDAASD
ncbi:MAG: lysophospholipid acyltransferase family protein [Oscillospiraceae bacterium]